MIALLNAENLQKGRHSERSARIRHLYDPLVQTIADVLRRGEQVGIFRPLDQNGGNGTSVRCRCVTTTRPLCSS